MNKKRISLAIASLFCAAGMLAGCGSADEVKEIASMKLSGIQTAYQVGDTINWSALKITVSYKDSKDKDTYTGSQIEYDLTSEVAETTKVVVYTAGLHSQTTLTEGEYNIEAALKSNLQDKRSIGRIIVGKVTDEKYTLDSFEQPEFVDQLETIKAGTHPEGSFKNVDDVFTVGTKNVFRFVPRASFELKEDQGAHSKRYTNYDKVFTLKEIKPDSSKVDALDSDWDIAADQSGIKLNDSAVGKKFELSVSPKDEGFAVDSNGHTAKVDFQFQVKDGLNIYEAKQLGVLNLSSVTMTKSRQADSHYIAHIGRDSNEPESGHRPHYFNNVPNPNGASSCFWDGEIAEGVGTDKYAYVDYVGLWKDYLLNEGVFTQAEIEAYTDIKGVFLQNAITLTIDDIPADYFVEKDESGNVGGYEDLTCLRDASNIYVPTVGIAENKDDRSQDVEINGNFFMLNNELPLCRSHFDKGELTTYTLEEESIYPGGACLVRFCGIEPEHAGTYYYDKADTHNGAHGIVKNLNTKGVVDDVSGDALMSVTAMIAFKNTYVGCDYVNNIIKDYQIGLFTDCSNIGNNTDKKVTVGANEVFYNTLIKDCKVYDCSNAGIYNYKNNGVVVQTSTFGRFGGSAILNAGNMESWREDSPSYWDYALQIYNDRSAPAGIDPWDKNNKATNGINKATVYVDTETANSFNNYVTGTEAYFTALGASFFFEGALTQYEAFLNSIQNEMKFYQDGHDVFNIISLGFDGDGYIASKSKEWYGNVVLNYDDADKLVDATNTDYANPFWVAFETFNRQAPIFYTEKAELVLDANPMNIQESEVFTCLYNPFSESPQPDFLKKMVTLKSALMFLGTGSSHPEYLQEVGHLEGTKLNVLLPADTPFGNTTIVGTFELKSIA